MLFFRAVRARRGFASCFCVSLALLSITGGVSCSRSASEEELTTEIVTGEEAAIASAPVEPPAEVKPKTTTTTPRIIPRPKRIKGVTGAPFPLTAATRIIVPDGATPAEKRGPELLREEIAARFGLNLALVGAKQAGAAAVQNAIVFDSPRARQKSVKAMQSDGQVPRPPEKPEGYAVAVLPRIVVIAGKDEQGMLWGAQTAIQLLTEDQGKPQIAAAIIQDWPTLSLRAVHLFYGQQSLPFHRKLIGQVLSRFKMNALFLEVERLRWDHDPKAAPAWGGTKAQVKEEIAYARAHGMTVYPLMQSYGHMQWLLDNPRRKHLAEDPLTPYAINFTDPKAVAYLEGFNAEAAALFPAPGFHIGMDEVDMRGRFPYQSKPRDFGSLIVRGGTHWRDFLRKRNKTVFMWADQALCATEVNPSFGTAPTPADAAKVRAGLPKDIVMVDWQYGEQNTFPSLQKLKGAGFKKIVAATWFRPRNIQNFSRAAAKAGAMGAIQTTWAGYESKESILQSKERKQFTAMVMAADYFWNGGEGPAPSQLPYDPEEVFTRQWAAADNRGVR